MTALTAQRRGPRTRAGGCERPAGGRGPASEPTLFDDERVGVGGGEPTLDELVCGVWEGLAAGQRVPCPLCGGEMVPGYGAHARVVVGRCGECATTLS